MGHTAEANAAALRRFQWRFSVHVVDERGMTDTQQLGLASNRAIIESNRLLGESNNRIANLIRYGHRSRTLIRILTASLVFDIVLTAGLGLAYHRATTAAEDASATAAVASALSAANKESILDSCLSGNVVRANDILIWTDFLSTPAAIKVHGTPAQDSTLRLVRKTFAPRNCPATS